MRNSSVSIWHHSNAHNLHFYCVENKDQNTFQNCISIVGLYFGNEHFHYKQASIIAIVIGMGFFGNRLYAASA